MAGFVVDEVEVVLLVEVLDDDEVVVGSSVVDVVVGHWQFTHSAGVQNAPCAEPSHCSPGSSSLFPQLLLIVVEDDDVDVLVLVVELVVGGCVTVVEVVVGH